MSHLSAGTLRRGFNLWPGFLFSGIRVREISPDWRRARVELRLHWYNRNFMGTHFGGNLFAMADPFWVILLLQRLGPNYHVWDQAAEIEFVQAVRAPVLAEFLLEDETVEAIRTATANGEKHLQWFDLDLKTADGTLVARTRKQLYVRLKRKYRPATQAD